MIDREMRMLCRLVSLASRVSLARGVLYLVAYQYIMSL